VLAKPENVLMMTSCGVLASCNVTGIAGGDDGGDECPQRAKLVVTAMSKNLLMMMLMTRSDCVASSQFTCKGARVNVNVPLRSLL
jgi:hypothetical protein